MIFKRPTVLYPTVVRGTIKGLIRCESLDGSVIWLQPASTGIWKAGDPVEDATAQLHHFQPFEWNGKIYGVSHIQKLATFFSLLFDPFIYHLGKFWHLQEYFVDSDGVMQWKPGTERGIYTRTPGWRWQVPDAKSEGTPWIFSGGRIPGGHLD